MGGYLNRLWADLEGKGRRGLASSNSLTVAGGTSDVPYTLGPITSAVTAGSPWHMQLDYYAHTVNVTVANASSAVSATLVLYDHTGSPQPVSVIAGAAFVLERPLVKSFNVTVSSGSAEIGLAFSYPMQYSSSQLLAITEAAAIVTISGTVTTDIGQGTTINTDVGQNKNNPTGAATSGSQNVGSQIIARTLANLADFAVPGGMNVGVSASVVVASAPVVVRLTILPGEPSDGFLTGTVISANAGSNSIYLFNNGAVLLPNQTYVEYFTVGQTDMLTLQVFNTKSGSCNCHYIAIDVIPQAIYPPSNQNVGLIAPLDISGYLQADIEAWNAGTLPVSVSGTLTVSATGTTVVSGSGTFNVALPTPSPLNATDFLGSVGSASAETVQATGASSSTVGNLVTYNLACQAGLLTTTADNLTYVAIKGKSSSFYYAIAFLESDTSGEFWVAETEQLEIVTRNQDTVAHAMFGSFVEVPKR